MESINCEGANTWTNSFFEYYLTGAGVQQACRNAANDAASEHWFMESIGQLNTDSYLIVS